jgi:hypothetical protein
MRQGRPGEEAPLLGAVQGEVVIEHRPSFKASYPAATSVFPSKLITVVTVYAVLASFSTTKLVFDGNT